MRAYLHFLIFLFSSVLVTATAQAYELRITEAHEDGDSVFMTIETDMPLPVQVMIAVSLQGQADDDVWIGNNQRATIERSPQTFELPATRHTGEPLPSGEYDAEVNFYSRWGTRNSPPENPPITEDLESAFAISIGGSGASAEEVARRDEQQRWLMLNFAVGDRWNQAYYESHLGPSERYGVESRNDFIAAYYFRQADMTIFVNELTNEGITWREGRQTRL